MSEITHTSCEHRGSPQPERGLYESASTGFWLNDWLVEPAQHQVSLYSHTDTTRSPLCSRSLEPRLMKLLCRLAEQSNRVISRDELISYLWPRVIVNENSLTRAVSDLRKALRYTPDHSVEIKTIPKRGYSLIAVAQSCPDNGVASETVERSHHTSEASEPPRRHWWHQWWPAFALPALMVAGLAALPGWLTTTSSPNGDNQQLAADGLFDRVLQSPYTQAHKTSAGLDAMGVRLSPLLWNETSSDKYLAAPAIEIPTLAVLSPERHIMAYVEQQDDYYSLKLRPAFAEAEPWTAFTTDETITSVQWSPLGDGVMFTVSSKILEKGDTASQRLMLLDINTLALHELYRKPGAPKVDNHTAPSGNLT
ncbi:winged helix-turn-helix domain-containing protein [Pseudohongiella spirulinae]|nr:winged helix-turn-helix domain-containing protein [Pseudohongiella spirulinae]